LRVVRRALSFGGLVWKLARSAPAREQLRLILGRAALPPAPPPPAGPGFVDVKDLLATLSVEELARTADEYFQRIQNVDAYLAKPFFNAADAADLLVAFCHVVSGLNLWRPTTILDFGAGTCWSTRCLVQMGHAVTAVDVSPAALEIGRQLFRRLPVVGHHAEPSFLIFDGHRFDLPDASVERIVCLNAFHHVPNQAEVLREMARVLRPGGIAGFSEPGEGHSRSEQSQYEMRHFTVVENDIVIEDVERLARDAGFERLAMTVFDSRPYLLDWPAYRDLMAGGVAAERYVDFVRVAASDRHAFFLYKPGQERADSRQGEGLSGAVRIVLEEPRVSAGGVLAGEAEVTNTGGNAWLPSDAPFGPVFVGVQLLARDGRAAPRDFERVRLPHGVAPGESARFRFTLPAPPPGEWRLTFDLVSERVCWFKEHGAAPAFVDVTVIPARAPRHRSP
jgi:SAM-dependent methyltransferase